MRIIKKYENFSQNEDLLSTNVEVSNGLLTLYRLTSHSVVDLLEPGNYYVSNIDDISPELLSSENQGSELFLITVSCPKDNVDNELSEVECSKHNCDSIISVKDDSKCTVVKVEPFKI